MKEQLYRFQHVLLNAEHFPWDAQLYLPSDERWSLSSSCAVIKDDPDRENVEDEPEFVARNNLRYVLQFSDVQSIVQNAREQLPAATAEELFYAFKYYFDNDAFVEFGNNAP